MTSSGDSTGPDAERLWQLYEVAVEEYRFQVNLNWQRLQYFIGLNVAVLGVGTGLLRLGGTGTPEPDNTLPGLVFLAGVILSAASVFLARVQQGYYRAAREQMRHLGRLLHVDELAIVTTAGARGERTAWWKKVRTVNELVLLALATLNGIGAAVALWR